MSIILCQSFFPILFLPTWIILRYMEEWSSLEHNTQFIAAYLISNDYKQ